MKIAFVYPECESLGIEYLSAVLKLKDHETKLFFDPVLFADQFFDLPALANRFDYTADIVERVRNYAPDVVALSVMTPHYKWALKFARELKKAMSTTVVMGGIHPTALPDIVMQQPEVDFVVQGEGESAFCDLLEVLDSKARDFDIENIWYRKNGKIIGNPLRGLCQNLDALPFPDKDLVYREVCVPDDYTVLTGRGCPYNCSYCNTSFVKDIYRGKGKFVRKRSPENVIEELELAKLKYRSKMVIFDDELLTYDKKWLEKFCSIYEKKIGLMSFCWVSPQSIDNESVKYLKRLRCYSVEMGVQTFNDDIRSRILNRFCSNDQVSAALNLLRQNKIKCIAEHMIGLPEETASDYFRIVDFYAKQKADKIAVYMLRYFPKTKIIEKAGLGDEEIRTINNAVDWKPFTVQAEKTKRELMFYRDALLLLNIFPNSLVRIFLEKKMLRVVNLLGKIFFITDFFLWFGNPWEYVNRWFAAGGIVIFRKISVMRYFLAIKKLLRIKKR